MRKLIFIFIILLFAGCTTSQNVKDDSTANSPKSITDTAISFHKWYIENINSNEKKEAISLKIIEDTNGKCKANSEEYFSALRKLGTISEKFIVSETERFSECSEYVSKIRYKDYKRNIINDLDECCSFLNYYYWINSQIPTQDVEAWKVNMTENKNIVNVLIRTFEEQDGEKLYLENYNIKLENENEIWRITDITLIDKEE